MNERTYWRETWYQVSDLPSISYMTLDKFLNCSFVLCTILVLSLYWPVEEVPWAKWILFLEQILYLFQTLYYTLANHLIMHTAKVRERMSNSKNFLLSFSFTTMHAAYLLHWSWTTTYLNFLFWSVSTNITTEIFQNCVRVWTEHMLNYSCKALGEPVLKRYLYWIKNSLAMWIFCFVSVVFLSFFPS